MDIKKAVLGFRSKIHKDGKFGVTRFEPDTKLLLEYGVPRDNIFRFWDVVEQKRYRALRVDNDFDIYRDSVYDYPIVAMVRLGKNYWENFNKSCMVHVGACCGYVCWHCYLDQRYIEGTAETLEFLTGREIVERYLAERTAFTEGAGNSIDLFRISGGEPFLVPELLLEVLQVLEEKGLSGDVFVWTETNLAPFYKPRPGDKSALDEIGFDISVLTRFPNFAIHPCFHGISKEDLERNTDLSDINFDGFLNAYRDLIGSGLDIYPTFGSNVNDPRNLVGFFNSIKGINRDSLLRFALIEYKTYYQTVVERLGLWGVGNPLKIVLELFRINNEKNTVIKKWGELIQNEFGSSYLTKERVRVALR